MSGGERHPAAEEQPDELVLALRAVRCDAAAILAAEFRAVAALDDRAGRVVAAELRDKPGPVARQVHEQRDDLVVAEVQTALGIGYADATVMVRRARQVVRVVPRVLAALDSGLLVPASGRCPHRSGPGYYCTGWTTWTSRPRRWWSTRCWTSWPPTT